MPVPLTDLLIPPLWQCSYENSDVFFLSRVPSVGTGGNTRSNIVGTFISKYTAKHEAEGRSRVASGRKRLQSHFHAKI